MAYDTYSSRNSECQNTLECIEEEKHPPPLLQLRQPRFQFRQMSEMQFHPLLRKEHSPTENLGRPLSQALQRPNILVRHLRPPRPLSQTLAECKQNALVPQLQEENAPLQKLRKPHPLSTASQKLIFPSQQARLVRLQQPKAELVQSLPEQQKPSLQEPQPLRKQQQPTPDKQELPIKQQQPSPNHQKPLLKQQQSLLKEPQPLRKQQQPTPDKQELSIKQQQPLPKELQPSPNHQKPSLKQQQPSPKEQQTSLKQQPCSPKQQVPLVKQQQTLQKQIQPSQIQLPPSSKQQPLPSKQQQAVPPAQAITPERRLLAKYNNDELQSDSSVSGKNSSGSILKVKKKMTPNNERRQLQNLELRKILMPKNAMSLLNEIIPLQLGLLTVQQISVNDPNLQNFCAEITVHDINYKGYGVSKSAARHDVAEQVFRDFILMQMRKQIEADTSITAQSQQEEGEKEPLPMVQLASFALHKLFAAWECAGCKVPLLKKLVTPTE